AGRYPGDAAAPGATRLRAGLVERAQPNPGAAPRPGAVRAGAHPAQARAAATAPGDADVAVPTHAAERGHARPGCAALGPADRAVAVRQPRCRRTVGLHR